MATTKDIVEQLRGKIARYQGPIGEQNTKAALIEPVLRVLGWDVEDVDEVHQEYKQRSMDNPVDDALVLDRKPVLFVEAKGLRESLDDRRWAGQIFGYAAVAGVEWVVLTNGDEYRIYYAHAPVPVQDREFRPRPCEGSVDDARNSARPGVQKTHAGGTHHRALQGPLCGPPGPAKHSQRYWLRGMRTLRSCD